ncbi:MAG TPA: hypothetical protein VJ482_08900 [Acidimicrobiia bacterium]|jgi:hypothetical protein|nr:hypothetical protein [Acidimicrobiia bacterium]
MRKWIAGTLIVVAMSACAPGTDEYSGDDPAGFFSGIWHGWIAPVTLIVQIFNDGVRIYEPDNTGLGYDFGFYIAVIAGFGSLSLVRRKDQKRRRSG